MCSHELVNQLIPHLYFIITLHAVWTMKTDITNYLERVTNLVPERVQKM